MLGKLLCRFGRHRWASWRYKIANYGLSDEKHWFERTCTRCRIAEFRPSSNKSTIGFS